MQELAHRSLALRELWSRLCNAEVAPRLTGAALVYFYSVLALKWVETGGLHARGFGLFPLHRLAGRFRDLWLRVIGQPLQDGIAGLPGSA
jgi:hypothetical protein